MNNFHQHINSLLDENTPYRKITKKEYKLKGRPQITKEIQVLVNKRDKLLHKFNKLKNKETDSNSYNEYKRLRNLLTSKKRKSKNDYYAHYFDLYKHKASMIWQGIKSLVNITTSPKKVINITNT